MKINKRNPVHWLCLALFGANVFIAMVLRPSRRRTLSPVVVFYGHKLNGNLLAIYNHLAEYESNEFEPVFLTMDPAYHRRLRGRGMNSTLAIAPTCIKLLARADAIISDHGLHVMSFMVGRTSLKFFDVWHGIPFKGFDADDFRVQRRFDEIWVASPLLKRLYAERFGFDDDKLVATGYPRTDQLVRPTKSRDEILGELGLASLADRKFVLYAPTWRHDSRPGGIYPFDLDGRTFLSRLADICANAGATLLVRSHLNSAARETPVLDNVIYLSANEYPNTEETLLVSDVLVCDWSSIAFDYLLLNRPMIFLDTEAPFAKGFSLGPEYRVGNIVANIQELARQLSACLRSSGACAARLAAPMEDVRAELYADCADGAAAARCAERLRQHLSNA
jgi:CDP-glycerol glycerophosphotransferase